jgi:hypothetical protein
VLGRCGWQGRIESIAPGETCALVLVLGLKKIQTAGHRSFAAERSSHAECVGSYRLREMVRKVVCIIAFVVVTLDYFRFALNG